MEVKLMSHLKLLVMVVSRDFIDQTTDAVSLVW